MAVKAAEEERLRNLRYLETTSGVTFVEKDLQQNVVGRQVMKT